MFDDSVFVQRRSLFLFLVILKGACVVGGNEAVLLIIMWCKRRLSGHVGSGSVPVHLNVYDLTPINGYAYWLGLGVYHSGVQVHGVEYAFGAHENPTTGIFEGLPKQCEGFRFRKTILVGKTDMGPEDVRAVMEDMAEIYRGNAYDLVTKNCNHFCNDACIRLTGNSIPRWVNRLARIGWLCYCVLPATLNSTKIQHHRIEDKACDGEKTELNSESIRTTVSNSSSDLLFSPRPTNRRGRSSRSGRNGVPLTSFLMSNWCP